MSIFLKGAGNSLIKIAEEMETSSKFINIEVHKSKILYENVEDYYRDKEIEINNPTTNEEKAEHRPKIPSILMAWNKQRNNTLQNYTITVKFYKNFNEEILSKIIPNSK